MFGVAESYYLEGKPKQAIKAYQKFLKSYPESQFLGEAKLKLAGASEELGLLGTAFKFADDAEEEFPNEKIIEMHKKGISKRSHDVPQEETP